MRARERIPELSCDDEGYYDPLQCRKQENSTFYACICVSRDGRRVEGSKERVRDPEDGPDCSDKGGRKVQLVNCRFRMSYLCMQYLRGADMKWVGLSTVFVMERTTFY